MNRITLQEREQFEKKESRMNRWSPVYMLAILAVVALIATGCAPLKTYTDCKAMGTTKEQAKCYRQVDAYERRVEARERMEAEKERCIMIGGVWITIGDRTRCASRGEVTDVMRGR